VLYWKNQVFIHLREVAMRNELLKEAFMRAHKTVDDVAQAVNVDPKTVQRWVNGRVPHARHRWAIAQLLDMREEDLWDLQELSKQPSLEIIMPYSHSTYQSSSLQMEQKPSIEYTEEKSLSSLPKPDLEMLMKSRRQILKEMLSTACVAFALSPSAFPLHTIRERLGSIASHPSSIDTEALDDLGAITNYYWKLSTNVSLDILSGVAGHFATITQLLRESHPLSIYERLCILASRNAQLMGKTFHDIREYDLAWEYYTFSLKAAKEARNPDLWAAGAGRIALLLIYWGQPEQALPLLHEAQRQELHNQRLRSWLFAIEAEIQAIIGATDACLRCLDESKNAALPVSLADDMYGTGFNPSRVSGYEGSCFVRLRQPERALPALKEAFEQCDPASLRRRSTLLADIGTVHAQLGDVETACSFILQALDVTEQTKSLIVLQRIYKGRKELHPWKESNEVKNLDDRVAGLLVTLTKLKEQVY
jgi:tetratricopeptide (TPR) repeat protein/transcriptional regulator with XRE-family HTH domain